MISLLALLMLISQGDYREELLSEKFKNEVINQSKYETKQNKIEKQNKQQNTTTSEQF